MTKIVLKVKLDEIKVTVNKEDYADAWREYREEEGDIEEGDDPGEPSTEFVLSKVTEEFEDGTRDLSETFENASVDVSIA